MDGESTPRVAKEPKHAVSGYFRVLQFGGADSKLATGLCGKRAAILSHESYQDQAAEPPGY